VFRLEVGHFPVDELRFGSATRWRDGLLEVDADESLSLVRRDPRIAWASLDIARPGESARIINVSDVWAAQTKVRGPGVVYPAVVGRDTAAVGQGRTHRLDGLGVVECSDSAARTPARARRSDAIPRGNFVDMAGPGSAVPFGRLQNLCLTVARAPGVGDEDWEDTRRGAVLRVVDRLGATIRELSPPDLEVLDTTTRDPSLPGFLHVPMLWSREAYVAGGARSRIGTAVYGLTRQGPPWLLQPTEVFDGAISGGGLGTTWYHVHNPVARHLCHGHGRRWNALGVVVGRTNWTSMAEKEVFAQRIAELARALGAAGAIVTIDLRGARFVETVLAVQALERAGIKTVFLTLEETSEDGLAPPLLMSAPEVVAVVSCGDGAVPGPFPAVERVVGARAPLPADYAAHPGFSGGYGNARYWLDYYGLGRAGGVDY
jgi:Glycine/sarcosine/betaine reductase component B subunits